VIPAKMRPLIPPVAACMVVLIASTLNSIDPLLSSEGLFDSWTYGLLSCALYPAVLFLSIRRPPWRRGLAWLGVALSIHAVIQRFGYDPLVTPRLVPQGHRAAAWVGSPVDLGAILAMLFFVGQPWQAALMCIGIWATGSRAPWLALYFGFIAMRWPKSARWMMVLAIIGCFFVPSRTPGDKGRIEFWKSAAETFHQYPLLGSGPDTFIDTFTGERLAAFRKDIGSEIARQGHAHNDILQALATTGIAGLLAYLWLLWRLPATPSLIALFVVMKFDPVALEVLALGAMLAGEAINKGDRKCRDLDKNYLISLWGSIRSAWCGIMAITTRLSEFLSRPASSIFYGRVLGGGRRRI